MPGQLADVAVADRDLFSVPHDQIVEAANDLTIVGGDVVYDRLGETA